METPDPETGAGEGPRCEDSLLEGCEELRAFIALLTSVGTLGPETEAGVGSRWEDSLLEVCEEL